VIPVGEGPGMAAEPPVGGHFDKVSRAAMPDQDVVAVHLLRHGDVEGLDRREVRGHLDAQLSAKGRRQHDALVSWFVERQPCPDLILSSDLSRCAQLAAKLARATGAECVLDAGLREQHMGQWEGRTWSEISAAEGSAVNDYWDDYCHARPPGGESFADMAARVGRVWQDRVVATPGQRVVLVTHAGVIRALLCRGLSVPLEGALRFAPPPASHTSVLHAAAGLVVQAMGEQSSLIDSEKRAEGPHREEATPQSEREMRPVGHAPRLALSGSAGTGKTTLGRRLADELSLPFIEEGMRRRLEAGLVLSRLDRRGLRDLVLELWQEQLAAEEQAGDGFVADRSSADYAAFWLHYGFHYDEADTEPFMERTLQHVGHYDRIVLLPWGCLPLAADGVRSTNRWLQFGFQSFVGGLLNEHVEPGQLLVMPPLDNFEARVALVLASLSE
jgi:broad specificity phosphatase PhoE/nicotinamide riboside kinase